MSKQNRRVVVTGLGVISPIGIGVTSVWNKLKEGVSGIGLIQSFDTSAHSVKIAAEILNFDPAQFIDPRECKRLDRVSQFAMVVSDEALKDAKLGLGFENAADPNRMAVVFGSGIGGIHTLEEQHSTLLEKGPRRVSPFMIPKLISNIIPGNISIRHNLKGPNFAIVSACATSTHAIGEAMWCILNDRADVVVTGGTEGAITPLTVAGFANMKALSTRNELGPKASSPFDKERDGFIIGEGGGCLVLEEYEHAIRRGAHIYAEIAGYGATCDANHITAPAEGGEGIVRAMNIALAMNNIDRSRVTYVNAHGTSTPANDKQETAALKTIFGDYSSKLAVSSTKSMVGHLLGGAGAIEAVATIKSMEEGTIHPTLNLVNPDPECDLDYVTEGARQLKIDYAISNSMGFGGQNASILFKNIE